MYKFKAIKSKIKKGNDKMSLNLLIVEDSKVFLKIVKERLKESRRFDLRFFLAENLVEAKHQLNNYNIDVILLDLILQDSYGLDTLKNILEINRDIPIIVLTGINDLETSNKAIMYGAQDYIEKNNFDKYNLERSIEYSLERNKIQNELRKSKSFEECISFSAQSLLSSSEGEWSIDIVLENIFNFSNIDIITFFKIVSQEDRLLAKKANKVINRNAKLRNSITGDLDVQKYLEKIKFKLYKGQYVNCNTDELTVNERFVVQGLETKSILLTPVWTGGDWYGFIVFEMKNNVDLWDEHLVSILLVISEIIGAHSNRIETRKKLSEKNDKLAKLNEEKNKFLGIAAHDLRSPLTIIQMYSEFLLSISDINLNEESRKFLNTINETSVFMNELLNDLLDISQIEAGKLELQKVEQNYEHLINSNIEFNSIFALKKGIKINTDIQKSLPLISVDKKRIEQVLNNIISNAIKYSENDTKILVKVYKKNNDILTEIIDHGQGIPEKEIKLLFQVFQKTSVQTTDGEKSTGLGLAIVQKLVSEHGGKIGVESKVGQGSKFYFSLPI